jgi:hypothetical protein
MRDEGATTGGMECEPRFIKENVDLGESSTFGRMLEDESELT